MYHVCLHTALSHHLSQYLWMKMSWRDHLWVSILSFLNWRDDRLLALMSDAVAHTLDGCEVQPLGEELNPEREELLVDMDVVRERGLEVINTTAYIAITGTGHKSIHPCDWKCVLANIDRNLQINNMKGSLEYVTSELDSLLISVCVSYA